MLKDVLDYHALFLRSAVTLGGEMLPFSPSRPSQSLQQMYTWEGKVLPWLTPVGV